MKTSPCLPTRSVFRCGLPTFAAGLMVASAVSAQTISSYSVEKRIDYNQLSSSTPVLGTEADDPGGSYVFDVNVNGSNLGSLSPVDVNLPGSAPFGVFPLTYSASDGGWHLFGGSVPSSNYIFTSSAALDANAPNGAYSLLINSTSVPLTLSGAAGASVYPAAIPTVTNGTWVGGVLMVNAATGFNFDFNNFATYSNGGGVGFSLYATDGSGNATTQLVNEFTDSAQTAALTSYDLVGGTLQAGQSYYAQLDFAQITALDTSSIGGATGFADFENETSFSITTAAAIPEPAELGWMVGAVAAAAALVRQRRRTLR
jgi:hypothetical protein